MVRELATYIPPLSVSVFDWSLAATSFQPAVANPVQPSAGVVILPAKRPKRCDEMGCS